MAQVPTLDVYAGSQSPIEQKRPNDLSEATVVCGCWASTEKNPPSWIQRLLLVSGRLSDLEIWKLNPSLELRSSGTLLQPGSLATFGLVFLMVPATWSHWPHLPGVLHQRPLPVHL